MLILAEAIPAVHADIFHVASILLAVKANFYEREGRKDKVRKCCRFFGLYAGEEVILDESSVPIPDPEPIPEQRSFFLSSIGFFLTKSVCLLVTLLSFFVFMMVKSTSGGSLSSQEAVFLISDV
jgi:hypothetical protein